MTHARRAFAGIMLLSTLPVGCGAFAHPLDPAQLGAPGLLARAATDTPKAGISAPSGEATAALAAAAGTIDIGAIAIRGLETLRPADFADLIAPCIGQSLSSDQLADLASRFAQRAHARGFAFATAWIEPQQLQNGVLAVRIDEGRIDEIRLQGAEHAGVRASLAPLLSGKPLRINEIERHLLIAGDINGVRVLSSNFFREGDKGVLIVTIRKDRVSARATLANDGTKPLGPEQLTLSADINGLLAADDSLSLTWSGTPFQPSELNFGRIQYRKRIRPSGTEVIVFGAMALARPGAYLQPLAIRSESWQAGISLLQPLVRRRAHSLWLQTDLNIADLDQTRAGRPLRDMRVVTARGTLYGYARLGGGYLRGSLAIVQGLGVFGATPAAGPATPRPDWNTGFTALGLWSEWTGPIHGALGLRLAMQGQVASAPLPITEELGLGGTGFLRGYNWFERSGDEGLMGLAELRYNWDRPISAVQNAQLYVFADGGSLHNLGGAAGGGSLASVGGGVRADITRSFGANLELAVPLSGPRYDNGGQGPKFNFRMTKAF